MEQKKRKERELPLCFPWSISVARMREGERDWELSAGEREAVYRPHNYLLHFN